MTALPERLAGLLVLLALLALLTIAPPLLTVLGIPYDAPGGSPLHKLHPGTYLVFAAFGLYLLPGNPLRRLGAAVAAEPAIALYLAAIALAMAHSVLRHGISGAAFIVDTLLVPGLLALLLARLGPEVRRRAFALILAALALNAALGIGEALLGSRLIPYTTMGGIPIVEAQFRATALLGHPLENALITGLGLLAAMTLRPPAARLALGGLLLLAMLAFGGRTALALYGGLLGLWLLGRTAAGLVSARYDYARITGGLALALAALLGLAATVVASGLGERIFATLSWDRSADVRIRSLGALGAMGPEDRLLGASPAEIVETIKRLGLAYPYETIENSWMLLLMQMGLPLFLVFALALALFCRRLARDAAAPLRLALLGFLVVVSSNNALAVKAPGLCVAAALLVSAGARREAPAARPAPAPAYRLERA